FVTSAEEALATVRPMDANRSINEYTRGYERPSAIVDCIELLHHGGEQREWSIEFTGRSAEVASQAAFDGGYDDPDLACHFLELLTCKLHRQKTIPAFRILQAVDEVRRLHIENGRDVLTRCPSECHDPHPHMTSVQPIHSPPLSFLSG